MLTSSPVASPDLTTKPRVKQKPVIATPQTSHTLSKSHRLLRPLKSKLLSIQQYHESNPSSTRPSVIWSTQVWPQRSRTTTKTYSARQRQKSSTTVANDTSETAIWDEISFK